MREKLRGSLEVRIHYVVVQHETVAPDNEVTKDIAMRDNLGIEAVG